jgi:hypothetical protein
MTNELENIFAKLTPFLEEGSRLIASATHQLIPGGVVLLAKTSSGCPCVVIQLKCDDRGFPPSIDLEYISVRHGVPARIHGLNYVENQRFSVILLKSGDTTLRAAFLRFIFAIASEWDAPPDATLLAKQLRDFLELLRSLREPPRKTIQGLWAELFLMAQSGDVSSWFDAWHNDPNEVHDFRFADGFVEAKSWAGGSRSHRFSHRQLWPQGSQPCFVASLLVEPSASGVSVLSLAERIRAELGSEQCVRFDRIVIQTLGSDYQNSERHRFDAGSAMASVRFYSVETLPRIPEDLPSGVSGASYVVDLDDELRSPIPAWLPWPAPGGP